MSSRRVLLHIGTEKTGSTALQDFLAQHRGPLNEQGFTYSRVPNETNHTALAAYAVDAERELDLHRYNKVTPANQAEFRQRISRRLSAELDTGRTVIISNEHLSSKATDPLEIERVARLFAEIDAEVEVIIYLRRLVPMMEASYSTFVKYWRTLPFSFEQESSREARYDLHALVERWETAFPGRLRVRVYREEWKQQSDALFRDFFEVANLTFTDAFVPPVRKPNPSPAREDTELLRLINIALSEGKTPARGKIRQFFIREIESGTIGPPFALTASQSSDLMSRYRSSLESLRERMGDEPVEYLLDQHGAARAPEPGPVTEDERASAVAALMAAAERALASQVEQAVTTRVDELSRARDAVAAERDAAREELQTARDDLERTRGEAEAARHALSRISQELDAARHALTSANDELAHTRRDAEELRRVTATRTWRWSAPARSALARLRRRLRR